MANKPTKRQLTTEQVTLTVGARVREIRLNLDLTMEQLAEDAGLSLGMLSKIENGQTSPSFGTLTALCNATGVPLTSLFRGLDEEHDAIFVPEGRGLEIAHEGGGPGRTYHDLGSLRGPNRTIEPVLITITNPDEVFPLFQHGGVELLHMLEGSMEYGYGSRRYKMTAGATLQIQGEVPHGPAALIELPVKFLSVKVYD